MLRLTALLLVTSLTACTMGASGKGALIAAGAGTMILGGMMISAGGRDLDHNGTNENVFDDDWGAYLGGTALFLLGTAILAGGVSARVPTEETPVIRPAPVPARVPVAMVSSGDDGELPDRPVAPEGLALAQRVRAYSSVNQCAAAWETWRSLEEIDPDYALVLRRSSAMGACRPPTP